MVVQFMNLKTYFPKFFQKKTIIKHLDLFPENNEWTSLLFIIRITTETTEFSEYLLNI